MTELPRVLDVTLSNDGSLSMPPRMLQVVQAANAPLTNGAHTPQSNAPQPSPVSPLLRGHDGNKRHAAGGSPDSYPHNNSISNNNYYNNGFPSGSGGSSSRLLGSHGDAAAASATSREARAAARSFHTVSLQRGRRKVLCSAEEDADEFVAYHSDAPPTSARSVVRSTMCMDRHIHERMYDDLRRAHQRDNNPESGMPDRGPLFTEVIIKQLQARDAQAGATTSPALSSSSMTGGAMTATTAGAASSASLSSWQAPPPPPPPMLYSSSPTRVTPLSLPQMLPVSGTAVTSASSLSSRAHAHERRSPSGVRHMNSSHSNYTSRSNSPRLPGGRKGGGGGGVVADKASALYAQPPTSMAASTTTSARASMYNDIVRPAVHMRPYHLPGIDSTDAFIAQEKARNFA